MFYNIMLKDKNNETNRVLTILNDKYGRNLKNKKTITDITINNIVDLSYVEKTVKAINGVKDNKYFLLLSSPKKPKSP